MKISKVIFPSELHVAETGVRESDSSIVLSVGTVDYLKRLEFVQEFKFGQHTNQFVYNVDNKNIYYSDNYSIENIYSNIFNLPTKDRTFIYFNYEAGVFLSHSAINVNEHYDLAVINRNDFTINVSDTFNPHDSVSLASNLWSKIEIAKNTAVLFPRCNSSNIVAHIVKEDSGTVIRTYLIKRQENTKDLFIVISREYKAGEINFFQTIFSPSSGLAYDSLDMYFSSIRQQRDSQTLNQLYYAVENLVNSNFRNRKILEAYNFNEQNALTYYRSTNNTNGIVLPNRRIHITYKSGMVNKIKDIVDKKYLTVEFVKY